MNQLATQLLAMVQPGPERCGLVLMDGTVVELPNVAYDPWGTFRLSKFDMQTYLEDGIAGSWHTHPTGPANLSLADLQGFKEFPEWEHYIASPGVVVAFVVEDGWVMNKWRVEA